MLVHDGLGLKYVFVQSQLLIVARNLSFGGNLVCVMLKFLLDVIPLDQKKKERRDVIHLQNYLRRTVLSEVLHVSNINL